MSVARNSSRFAPYYDFKLYNMAMNGFESNKTRAFAASPTVQIGFGSVVASATTSVTNGLWKSTNNISWSLVTSAPNTAIYSVAYGNNVFVAVGAAGVIFTSPGTDGTTWTARTKAGASTNPFNRVFFVNGVFFAQQQSDNVQYSTDGITWAIVGGATSNIPNTPDADQGGHWVPSLVYSKGAYIWFTGSTATTASQRIYWINQSQLTATGVNWSNNVVGTTAYGLLYGRQDPGDGLGPIIQAQSGSTYEAEKAFVRVNTANVDGSFATTTFLSSLENPRINGGIDGPTTSVPNATGSGTLVQKGAGYNLNYLWKGLYYKDGWYTSVFPSAVEKTRLGSNSSGVVYGIGVSRWSELEFVPGVTQEHYEDNRVTLFPSYLATAGEIENRFKRVAEWDYGDKKVIVLNGTAFGDVNNMPPLMLIGTRAFRPLRTTIGTARS
jgi:hypothetical protein